MMIAEKQKSSNIRVGIGFVLEIVGRILTVSAATTHNIGVISIGSVIALVGFVLFVWGCMLYCQGKGYSGWLGLLGIFSILGLLILVLLPDKYKGGMPPPGITGSGEHPGVWPPPPSGPKIL